jgi:sortase A
MAGAPYTPEYLRTETRKPDPSKPASRVNRSLILAGSALVIFSIVTFVSGLVMPGLVGREAAPITPARGGSMAPGEVATHTPGRRAAVEDEGLKAVREERGAGAGLRLTVPGMGRVDGIPVRTATPEETGKLDAGAIRLNGTGLPWQREANVYIAGHRVGYAGTGSFLLFFDLDRLREGDEVLLEGRGRRYVYRVSEKLVVGPEEERVMETVPGKNIVSLQTCTLPDYSRRLIVRAELQEIQGPGGAQEPRA